MPTPTIPNQTVTRVGTVITLSRYPVKSMGPEPLTEADLYFQGVRGDRRFAFIQGRNRSSFPWLTARDLPRMLHYKPIFTDPTNPDNSDVLITTPEGLQYDIFDPSLIEELRSQLKDRLRDQDIYAVHLKAAHDDEPFSMLTTHAIEKLSNLVGDPVDPRRFRQNLIIDTTDSPHPDEQLWVGSQLIIGDHDTAVPLAVSCPDPRCMMPNLDPDTLQQDPRILRAIAQQQNNMMGVFASILKPGTIRLGDPVYLVSVSRA
ncbi:MAG: MOSC domain-containing protein [Chloroflexia bacterium]